MSNASSDSVASGGAPPVGLLITLKGKPVAYGPALNRPTSITKKPTSLFESFTVFDLAAATVAGFCPPKRPVTS